MSQKPKLNADLGEGMGNDELLMPYLDSCSIACGGHTGDQETIHASVDLALAHSVEIGAHPSFPDKENFGRVKMIISGSELKESISNQVGQLYWTCLQNRTFLAHIKAHGALYNLAASDREFAELLLSSLVGYERIPIYAPWNSELAILAKEKGFQVVLEAFADRRYMQDGSLAPRTDEESVITNKEEAVAQVESIFRRQKVTALTGVDIELVGETFCIHGDNPAAAEILIALRAHKFEI